MTRSPNCQRPGALRGSRRLPARFVAHAVVAPALVAHAVVAPALVALAILALVLGVLPVPTSLSGGTPLGVVAAPAACATPSVDGTIAVAVAVDPGGVPGMAGGLETMCVTVSAGATGAEVLAARARALGRPMPRYASSGLLCAIDGQPATGCGERVDGAYRYWAYFLGSGSWTYAGTGPALRRANAGQLEGWRFVAGAGNATDPPPRTSASPASICVPAAAPSPTVAPAPAAPGPAPIPGGGAGSDVPGTGSSGGGAGVGFGGMGRVPTTGGGGGAGGDPDTGGGGAVAAGSGGGGGDEVGSDGATPGGDAGGGTPGNDRSGGGDGGVEDDGDAEVAGDLVADATRSSAGPSLGVLAVVALVGALVAGAVLQVRRRGAA